MADIKLIPTMKEGSWTTMTGQVVEFTKAMLKEVAESYDPKKWAAPLVIGHPKIEDPAFGQVDTVSFDGEFINSVPVNVNPEFATAVEKKAFPNVSAKFWQPKDTGNPTPGKWYLRHIGFFGAWPTSLKGHLPATQFASGDDGVTFIQFGEVQSWDFTSIANLFTGIREWIIAEKSIEDADRILPRWQIDDIERAAERLKKPETDDVPAFSQPTSQETGTMTEQELKDQQTQLKKDQLAFSEGQAAHTAKLLTARKEGAVAFCQGLSFAGRNLKPEHQAVIADALVALPEDASIEFGEGDDKTTKPLAGALRELLTLLGKQDPIVFGEVATGTGTEFAASQDDAIDTSELGDKV